MVRKPGLAVCFSIFGVIFLGILLILLVFRGALSEKNFKNAIEKTDFVNMEVGDSFETIGIRTGLPGNATFGDFLSYVYFIPDSLKNGVEDMLASQDFKDFLSGLAWGYTSDFLYDNGKGSFAEPLSKINKLITDKVGEKYTLKYDDKTLQETSVSYIVENNGLDAVSAVRFVFSPLCLIILGALSLLCIVLAFVFAGKGMPGSLSKPGSVFLGGGIFCAVIVAIIVIGTMVFETMYLIDDTLINGLITIPFAIQCAIYGGVSIVLGIILKAVGKNKE